MKQLHYEDIDVIKTAVNPFYRVMKIHLYLIDGLLIDTGPRIRKFHLIPAFKSGHIFQIALTHSHDDHAGMVRWVSERFSVDIFCHEKALRVLSKHAQPSWYRRLFSSPRIDFQAKVYPSVIRTPDHEFIPIAAPGHTADHVCLLEPDRGWLFSGDLYITPYPKVFLKQESIHAYIASLQKLMSYNIDTIFCAHTGIIHDGKDMLKRKLDYLLTLRQHVTELHQAGLKDREIRKQLLPDKVRLELMSFGLFSRLNLIRSCYRE
ncbi:MBL fold metallo-hydrolase [Lentibacillus salicampi]|uniref:MBL fold metallo-hydrolase n=1 Tax=Lentibacillus salicampi TaxID=175306 RepID=A0A4Y9AED2_9BACI|nr:MBL fold metallo-hydrolase [Lentibacillus salicampi]TFJ94249.1 MBL fold metallo-hydrolase [Lentibacillus salicampi]